MHSRLITGNQVLAFCLRQEKQRDHTENIAEGTETNRAGQANSEGQDTDDRREQRSHTSAKVIAETLPGSPRTTGEEFRQVRTKATKDARSKESQRHAKNEQYHISSSRYLCIEIDENTATYGIERKRRTATKPVIYVPTYNISQE